VGIGVTRNLARIRTLKKVQFSIEDRIKGPRWMLSGVAAALPADLNARPQVDVASNDVVVLFNRLQPSCCSLPAVKPQVLISGCGMGVACELWSHRWIL
jgi:hypothetical protein